jgi:hypothetical protein
MSETKGRPTIRKRVPRINPVVRDPLQPETVRREPQIVGLWSLPTQPNTTLGRLQRVYLNSLDVVDAAEEFGTQARSSEKLTPAGQKDQALEVIQDSSFCLGAAPIWREDNWPSLNNMSVGIEVTLYLTAVA